MPVADVSSTPVSDMLSLEGRIAVVTGGARGIGEAICRRFAEAGADVLVADLDEALAVEVAAALAAEHGHRASGVSLDVADERAVEETADRAVAELGGIDIWVNNAGIFPTEPFLAMSAAAWDKVLGVNLRGTFLGAHAAATRMVSAETPGVIINITSTAAFQAAPGLSHYVSSKHGVRGLTKALAVELGPSRIRVLAIAPTLIETPGIEAGRVAFEAAGMGDLIDSMASTTPLRRSGVPDDVARVALFCASDMSILMTGSTLAVDAGNLA